MEQPLLWFSIILPCAVGTLCFSFGRRSGYAVALSSAISFLIIASFAMPALEGAVEHVHGFEWWGIPGATVSFGLIIDPISVLMGAIVSFISLAVFIYSIEYMRTEEGPSRFWFLMSCFESSMLLLVFSDNFIMSFLGWEGVGLSSYFLIGHYYRDQKERWLGGPEGVAPFERPSVCGEKALLTTGVADSLMLVGILMIFSVYGTFDYLDIQSLAPTKAVNPYYILAASLLLVMGPLGKSAQFPFNEWLPEAMSGPTPVSALLHSATMVKAGVYLVARVSPIFYSLSLLSPLASTSFFLVAAAAGLLTALLGSLYGMFALEMKKVLAYSTVSQLGFMFVALGIAGISGNPLLGLSAAIFHIFSHSIFKASLFLGAGSAIHLSHTIYITEMGSLMKKAPKTFVAMLISALSLCALPPLMGFWSKDAILAAVYPVNAIAATLLAASSAMTCFYSVRLLWYTFVAPARRETHAKETLLLVAPALLLSGLTLVLGFFGKPIEHSISESLSHALGLVEPHSPDAYAALFLSAFALLTGFGTAYLVYFRRQKIAIGVASLTTGLRDALMKRPVDRLYSAVTGAVKTVSRGAYSFEGFLDKSSQALARTTLESARRLSRVHSGDLNRYLSIAGALLLLLIGFLLLVNSI
ncbi:MAG: NADH-quinone oxidoreductase subunit L [Candidatus Methanosuratincola sp.]|jgi:NADH-quinone oxidoreductase subunit L|nr:NADH-quinone oxidoreductase subunit L [Candidatus Methanosuratincola sp.]